MYQTPVSVQIFYIHVTSVCARLCVHVCSHVVSHVVSHVGDHLQEGCRGLPCVRRRTSGRPKAVLVKYICYCLSLYGLLLVSLCALTCAHTIYAQLSLWSLRFKNRKGVRIEREFSPNAFCFLHIQHK